VIRRETRSLAWEQLLKIPAEVSIEAGVFAEQGGQAKKRRRRGKKAPRTLAEIAAIHEFGAILKDADGNKIGEIPQRSFLRAWFDANQERIQAYFLKRLEIEGFANWDRVLEQLALWLEAELRRNIRSRIPPPLALSTIRRKGSTVPLIDVSQLINAITAKVEGKAPNG
jgi:hypothetical protein